ncbi:Dabb family protein [Agrococcus sp. ARC_14]|uniref:Dabb family protein n=1 Tax=Agrococcus sp. ARC_14 TaxID=2919927 RepID=UPI001F06D11A|nr:Dabb family protein [Agrococcus sp. ARC_14]MCH1884333.1 Dabb family protein [Agrococcus sp. ARC_14]
MIRHTVAFTLAHASGSEQEHDFLTAGPAVLRAIPGVEEFTVSRQTSEQSGYAFQFAMTFADATAYAAYDAHPDHREFVASRWANEVVAFEELDFAPYP